MSEKDNTAHDMSRRNVLLATTSIAAVSALGAAASVEKALAQAQPTPSGQRPNILFIMGDDVGWFNIGAYHRGIMSGKTPNLDKLASEGMMYRRPWLFAQLPPREAARKSILAETVGMIKLARGLELGDGTGADCRSCPSAASRTPRPALIVAIDPGGFDRWA